jgi:protein TonB
MTHALPALAHDLDPKRIAATAATIAVHLLALMLLLAPVRWTPPPVVDEAVTTVAEWKRPIIPPPPPPPPPQETHEVTHRAPVEAPARLPDPPPVIFSDTSDMATPVQPYADKIDEIDIDPVPTGPVALTVLHGPAPPYPARLQAMGVTGRVVLRIEVDAMGRPTSGSIESSSGSRLLDEAALNFVVKKWRFEPAKHAGVAIAATALVPIVYSLQ